MVFDYSFKKNSKKEIYGEIFIVIAGEGCNVMYIFVTYGLSVRATHTAKPDKRLFSLFSISVRTYDMITD